MHDFPIRRGSRRSVLVLLAAAVVLALAATPGTALADVLVTPGTAKASRATNAETGTGVYTAVSTITIAEGISGDLPPGTERTALITAPPGWEFRPGPLSTDGSTLVGTTAIAAEATATEITITYTKMPAREVEVVRIGGLFARPAKVDVADGPSIGRGTRGTATIEGFEAVEALTLTIEVGPGKFAAAPVFSPNNLAQAVFQGGTVTQLAAALADLGATGAWAQDANGRFVVYVVNGGFVNEPFEAAFPAGVPGPIALTVARGGLRGG